MESTDNVIIRLHKQVLYPTVRVRTEKAGGSGTVAFSGKNCKDKVETYVITNHHVVADAIEVRKIWDARLGRDVKRDVRSTVSVEFFKYNNFSHCIGSFGVEADIMAYDAEQDVALLRLRDEENVAPYIAKLFPLLRLDEVHLFDDIYACGAALGHSPIPTKGEITFMDDEIDNYKYWMSSALTIFGNSGGAVYRLNEVGNYEWIGIPSRISMSMAGFSASPITHMGYFIPAWRVYRFLDVNHYQFVYDDTYTIEQCEGKRNQMKEKEVNKLEMQFGVIEEDK
jgi:S1-C subfamily serine protease